MRSGIHSNSPTNHSSYEFRTKNLKQLKDLPFFRSLDPRLADRLLALAKIVQVPARSYVCRAGERRREMYVILTGQASVYKPLANDQHQWMAHLSEGSLFGEAGFFLGVARTADIVTQQDSEILIVPYQADLLDTRIDKDKAQGLQLRFWIQQAFQNSTFFKGIPPDCLDALGFAGKVVRVLENKVLFQEGQMGHTAYIVIQGSLVASQRGQTVHLLNQGAFFGEISLLLSQGRRTASVRTQKECLLLEIQRDEFYRLLAQNIFLGKELEMLAHERLLKDQQRSTG